MTDALADDALVAVHERAYQKGHPADRVPIQAARMAREWLYQDAEVYGVIRDRHQQSGWTPQALTTAICRRLGVIPPALDDHGNLRWKNSRVVRLDSPHSTALQSLTP